MDKLAILNSVSMTRRHALRLGVSGMLAAAALSSLASPSRANSEEAAGAFLLSLTTRSIEKLTDTSIPEEERKARFRKLFRDNFDISAIGRFVLGRYGRGASKPVLKEFFATFEDVMVERFAPQFAGYGETRFQIGTVRKLENRNQYIVSSSITPPGKENKVSIDWRLRYKNDRFVVLDIVGEGVSMALTLRAEYGSVLKNSGGKVDQLIAMLRERIGDQAAAN
jgi:phospholipid transport system substrate-binding protein